MQGRLVEGTVDFVKDLEGTLSPDDEATKVSARRELEDVQAPDVDDLDTRDVAEGLDDTVILIVDNKRTTALAVTAVPELALTGAELARVGDLDDVGVRVQGLEERDSLLGLREGLDGGVDNEGNFGDGRDLVTTGE